MGSSKDKQNDGTKQPWGSMDVRDLGELSEVVRSGGGKLTSAGGDPGENRKQSGGGG